MMICQCSHPAIYPDNRLWCVRCSRSILTPGALTLAQAAGAKFIGEQIDATTDAVLRTEGKRQGPIAMPRRPAQRIEFRNDHGASCTCFHCAMRRGNR